MGYTEMDPAGIVQDSVDGMIQHLASLADKQLILSFAPKTFGLSLLKRIGEFFPGRSQVGLSLAFSLLANKYRPALAGMTD